MPLLAIPNVSIGVPGALLDNASGAIERSGARVIDLHTDAVHNRSVLTVTGRHDGLTAGMVALAAACIEIDLTTHEGVHPRLGGLDVCPFVPHETSMNEAIAAAHTTGATIGNELGVPVFFYGNAARRPETRQLPDIRRGGLEGVIDRIAAGLAPDAGSTEVDARVGVVCVGARGPLIAFNVWLRAELETAKAIAALVREPGRVRALGLDARDGRCQVSMNLTSPNEVGIEEAFERVEAAAATRGAQVVATEIVGLVADDHLPSPDAKVTRLLIEPGHSLVAALGD